MPPTVPKKKGDSDNKKRIRSQAFKADKLVQILLKYEAIEDVSDVDGLREYIAECDHVSRADHRIMSSCSHISYLRHLP